jgi:hypothetical protein
MSMIKKNCEDELSRERKETNNERTRPTKVKQSHERLLLIATFMP